MDERKMYRLVRGDHYVRDEDGKARRVEPGTVIPLTASQALAFADRFEPVDTADQARTLADILADAPAGTEGGEKVQWDLIFLDGNMDAAIAGVRLVSGLAALEAAEKAERSSEEPRVTVLRAVDVRRRQLETEG